MASCTIYAEVDYTIATNAQPSDGVIWNRDGNVGEQAETPGAKTVWSRVRHPAESYTYVKRPTGWAAVVEPSAEDVLNGYRVLLGGYQNQVSGQELSDMFDDGALPIDLVCASTSIPTLFNLVDDLGDPMVDDRGRPLQALLIDAATPIELTDGL